MFAVLSEATSAWKAYEGTVDWSEPCDGGDYPNMNYWELTRVMDAMDDLDAALFAEEEKPGSSFAADVSRADREKALDKAKRVLAAYQSFLNDGGEFRSNAEFEPYARRVSEALGIKFVGRREGGSTGRLML